MVYRHHSYSYRIIYEIKSIVEFDCIFQSFILYTFQKIKKKTKRNPLSSEGPLMDRKVQTRNNFTPENF